MKIESTNSPALPTGQMQGSMGQLVSRQIPMTVPGGGSCHCHIF